MQKAFQLSDCTPTSETVQWLLAIIQHEVVSLNLPIDKTNKLLNLIGTLALTVEESRCQLTQTTIILAGNVVSEEIEPDLQNAYLAAIGTLTGTVSTEITLGFLQYIGMTLEDLHEGNPRYVLLRDVIMGIERVRNMVNNHIISLSNQLDNTFPTDTKVNKTPPFSNN